MLEEINGLTQKGYGNVTNIVEKYSNKLGPPKDKVQKYYSKDGSFKGFNFNDEQRKIRGAVIAETKKLNLIDMPNNMIKAVEDYKKLGKEIPRGMPQKIIKANKVPESQFYKILNKVDVFVKQKKKFTNLDASKKFQQDQRAAALKEYSSDGFERMTRGSKTIQGGHTGDIYNEFVTTSTKAYTPAKINQEALKEVDGTLKNIGLKRDAAIKAKDFVEVERLNTKGINLSAATEGYKTFKVVQPDGSDYIYGINQKITTDPMDLTRNLDVKELTSGKDKEFNLAKKRFKAKQITAEEFEIARTKAEKKLFNEGTSKELIKVQKKNAMKNAKISTKETNRISKQILSAMEKLGCGQAAGGRIMFGNGTTCAIKGEKKLNKLLFQGGGTTTERGLIQKIISGGGKMALSMLNPAELIKLKNLVGPGALGLMGLYEAGSITDDVLRLNKPLDEALAGNWLTKSFLPYSEEFAKQKNLLQSGASMSNSQREYALEMMKIEKAIKEGKRIESMESTQVVDGAFDDNFTINSQEKIDAAKRKLTGQANRIKESSFLEGSGRQLENKALMDDYEDAQKARTGASTIFGGPQRLVNTAPRPKNMGRGPMTEKKRMKLDFSIPGITPYNKTYTPSDKEISDYYQTLEKPRPLNPGEGTEIRMGMGGEGLYGTQGKFAGGGLASLKKKYYD